MNTLGTLLWFLIILSVVVISHEFGHFIVARMNGIRVIEFDVGMGPTLFHFTRKGTRFCLKALPLGGACVFDGMEIDTEAIKNAKKDDGGENEEEIVEDVITKVGGKTEKSFREASVWSRIATVLAGPCFNFILGMIFAIIIVSFCGSDLPVISGLTEGRPAATSGLSVGDTITKINGESVHIWRDITLISILNSGEELTVEYLHDGNKQVTNITPAYSDADNRYYIGIEGGNQYIQCKGFSLFKYSWYELRFNFNNTLKSLSSLIRGKLSMDNVAGPVGIAEAVGDNYVAAKEYGLLSVVLTMMNFAMLLSVNLGVLNLLPLPAIDGGKLVFMLIELVRGKPVPPEKEGIVHLIGIILLFLLTIFVFLHDIMRLLGR